MIGFGNRTYTFKPYIATSLGNHPRAMNLQACYLINEGNILEFRNIGLFRPNISGSSSFFTRASSPDGFAFTANSNNDEYICTFNIDTTKLNWNTGTIIWTLFPSFTIDSVLRFQWGVTANGFGANPKLNCTINASNNWVVGWIGSTGIDYRLTLAATTSNLVQNTWQTYAFTWDTSNNLLYRNGLQIGSNSTPPIVGFLNAFHLFGTGSIGSTQGVAAGTGCDRLYIYNRALSSSEIQDDYIHPYDVLTKNSTIVNKLRLVTSPTITSNYIISDRVKESSTTTGTGNFTLLGAETGGYQAFSDIMNVNEHCPYTIENPTVNEWETGLGVFLNATTFQRETVKKSSNSGALVNFSSGVKNVFIDIPASLLAALSNYNLIAR